VNLIIDWCFVRTADGWDDVEPDAVAWIDVAALDEAWRGTDQYIEPGGANGEDNRYLMVGAWFERNRHCNMGYTTPGDTIRLDAYLFELEEAGEISAADRKAIVQSSSSHSMRVGCDQDLFAAGLDIGAIMQGLRWSNPKQPLAYARHLAPSTSKLAAMMRHASRRSDPPKSPSRKSAQDPA
jgi:hypothetical protein